MLLTLGCTSATCEAVKVREGILVPGSLPRQGGKRERKERRGREKKRKEAI